MTRPAASFALMLCAFFAPTAATFGQEAYNVDSCQRTAGPQLVLRQDFSDVPIYGCNLKSAVGSRASYTYDDVHKSSALSLDGLVALNFRQSFSTMPGLYAYIPEISFGPYAQGAGTHAFATSLTPRMDSGSVAAGGYVQFFLEQPPLTNLLLPFVYRFRGGEQQDTSSVKDGVFVGEIIPAFKLSELFPGHKFGAGQDFGFGQEKYVGPLRLIFSPEFEVQYDSYQSGPLSYNLFLAHHEALRVGPLLVLKMYGFDHLATGSSDLAQQLKKIALSASYHEDWDVLSNRRYYSVQPALIYNLDDDAHYAVTTSYSVGDSETTGAKARQVKVAFSAKF